MAINETKLINKSDEEFQPKRKSAQKLTFEQLRELVQRNVYKGINKSFTQYNKEMVKQYLRNPANSLDKIIEISRFLERNSTLYKKMLNYYATTPLFYYNITQENDLSKEIDSKKAIKDFLTAAKEMHGFNLAKEFYNAIYCMARDGMFVGYTYSDNEHTFFMPLDIKYCRIYGRNEAGEWIVYFNTDFFAGNNVIYVEGVDGDGIGVWDPVFVEGWKHRKENKWFMLPPEKTFCLISGSDDQFDMPLPLLVGLIILLMDLEDLADTMAEANALENYKLLVSKIPLIKNSDDVDDFQISLDLAKDFDALFEGVLPELVGHVISPMELDTVDFSKSNSAKDTDDLAQSMNNLFNNAGISQIVVAGGSSSNSVGLMHAIRNDLANIWIYVNRIESWLNYYFKKNISKGYKLKIHKISWYNEDEYVSKMKDIATLGGSALDYLTACGDTPYAAIQKINFENAIGIKNIMIPLQSSYNMSSKNNVGAPTKDDTDLSPEGAKTRDGEKNQGTKANQ